MRGPLKTLRSATAALLPTHQKTLQELAPLSRVTLEPEVVLKAVPILKMNWAFAVPAAFSLRVPLRAAVVAKL